MWFIGRVLNFLFEKQKNYSGLSVFWEMMLKVSKEHPLKHVSYVVFYNINNH